MDGVLAIVDALHYSVAAALCDGVSQGGQPFSEAAGEVCLHGDVVGEQLVVEACLGDGFL